MVRETFVLVEAKGHMSRWDEILKIFLTWYLELVSFDEYHAQYVNVLWEISYWFSWGKWSSGVIGGETLKTMLTLYLKLWSLDECHT